MAGVFISYERQSQPVAQRLAERLIETGCEVWWDEQIPAYRAYAEVIEERLRGAACVIVLWSASAAKSQWVRAEADIARDEGKLIQATVDGCAPPLPFDQLQHADLRGWAGDSAHPGWRKIEAAVRDLVGSPPRPSPLKVLDSPVHPLRARSVIFAVSTLALVAIAVAAWWILAGSKTGTAATGPPQISVMPLAIGEPNLRPAASSIQDQIVRLLSAGGLAPTTGSGDAPVKATLIVDGDLQTDGDKIRVTVRVKSGRDQRALWSNTFEGPTTGTDALSEQVAVKVTDVVNCGVASLAPGVDMQSATRSLFLRSCDAARAGGNADQVLDLLRRVIQQSPNFADGLGKMAVAGVIALPQLPSGEAQSVRAEAAAAADRALKLDPKRGDAYLAKSLLVTPRNDWLKREQWLVKGESHSSSGTLYSFEGDLLAEVGRLDDALISSRRAVVLDPYSAPKTADLIKHLMATGELTEAKSKFSQAERTWPDASAMRGTAFALVEFADPDAGLRLLEDPTSRPVGFNDEGVAAWRAFVSAQRTRSPADATRAAAQLLKAGSDNAINWDSAVRALLVLGHSADVVDLYRQRLAKGATLNTSPLFSPQAAVLRRTPEFMALARDLGLVAYWRASSKWPDFCADPGLPYKCRGMS